jgi:hypothetical protein
VVGSTSNANVTPAAKLAAPSAQIALNSDRSACPRGGAAPKMLLCLKPACAHAGVAIAAAAAAREWHDCLLLLL